MVVRPEREERLETAPPMETYMSPLGLGGKVDAVRAASAQAAAGQQTEQPRESTEQNGGAAQQGRRIEANRQRRPAVTVRLHTQ
jgi:hypothetical protein